MSDDLAFLVVGGGPAGLAAARAYRDSGGDGPVAIVADEERMPYERPPLTKELLRGESDESDLPIEEESWLAEQDVRLVSGRAVALDAKTRTVTLAGGRALTYATCLLATGAEPTRLPVPGADDPGVRVIRTLAHLRELRARLTDGAPVIVVGSGFIGCEIAASLRALEHPVTLLSAEPAPNVERLGGQAAARIRGWLEDDGVTLGFGSEVERIVRDGAGLTVHTGEMEAAGAVVVMATGVAPRSELGHAAGAEVSDGRALETDERMRTSLEGILAAGDTAHAFNATAGRALRVEHWGDALGQGEVAGRTAAGTGSSWTDVPGFWSSIGARTLKYAAWGDGFDEVRFESHPDGAFTAWYAKDGAVAGVLTHGADEDYERGRRLIAEGAPWT